MILFWRIRYLDRQDRTFKDCDLYLDTSKLDAKTRAAVELCCELNESGTSREILKYRDLFLEDALSVDEKVALCGNVGFKTVYFANDYFEDECSNELSENEVGRILTGSPTTIAIPPGARQHDIDYMLAPPNPIRIDELHISDPDLEVFSYFVRDLRELEGTAITKDGPGRISWSQGVEPWLHTAVSDEEIRSFLTIFRRLYMSREPANFLSVVASFADVVGDFPLIRWIQGIAHQYEIELAEPPHLFPVDGAENITFSRKRLIDVFLYTRYAHQPNAQRLRQFEECLEAVRGRHQLLTYLFLTELWLASVHMLNAGRVIARVYDAYCENRGCVHSFIDSIHKETPGIGQLEKKEQRRQRILAEKTKQLAELMWEECGKPDGGPALFLPQAREQLNEIE
jgi:hypothetical protein